MIFQSFRKSYREPTTNFGKKEMDGMIARAEMAKEDYDDYRRAVPRWYSKDMAEKYGKGMDSHLIFQ